MNPEESQRDKGPLDELAFRIASQPVGLSGKLGRAIQILQHYQLSQIARRLIRIGQRKLQPNRCVGNWKSSTVRLNHSPSVFRLAKIIVESSLEHPSHVRSDLSKGKFVLLNHELQTGEDNQLPAEQSLQEQTHLWRFQYHYHEFLLTTAAKGNWDQVETFLNSWLDAYAPQKTKRSADAWHPYCISRRVPVWLWLLVLSDEKGCELGEQTSQKLLHSLEHQTEYLSKNLEWELGGNHLIENATALAIAGGVLDSSHASSWLETALSVLAKEIPKQVLSHGEHFERSPMYHCQVLSDFLRIAICCKDSVGLVQLLDSKIDSMLQFLNCILHPDNEIPLLADSVFHEAPSVSQIREVAAIGSYASSAEDSTSRVADYFIFSSEDTHTICDFGPIAAPHLPAHGHCDALNLEVSVGGKRWIVDSGNFNYSNDSMRHYCRSSIGHNVVTVDDANQANVWSMFRMGRRPRISGCREEQANGWHSVSSFHDGYLPLGVDKLGRLVATRKDTLICLDFHSSSPRAKGKNLVGYIHFHPEVNVGMPKPIGDGRFQVCIQRSSVERWLTLKADTVTIEQGWYCEQFGKREAGAVIRYVTSLSKGYTGWIMQESSDPPKIEFRDLEFGITMNGEEKFCWKWNLGPSQKSVV